MVKPDFDSATTAIGTPNIAFIKYWGKRDDSGLNTPNNSSISMTLDETLSTKTSVLFSERLGKDALYINGDEEPIEGGRISEKSAYLKRILDHMKRIAGVDHHALIVSENSFPSGAGIASSASGAATLVFALSEALNLEMSRKEMSITARQISGSACRSLFGGIVKWRAGTEKDGSDSYAEQVFDSSYWPELIDIIAIVDSSKKRVSSSAGHAATVKTSVLYGARPAFAENGVSEIERAVAAKDLNRLSMAIMRDSNNMHATMLDTWPPIMYLSDASKDIIYKVHELNESEGKCIAGYTFDAGPNAHIITSEEHRDRVMETLSEIDGIRETIESHMGGGPRLLEEKDCLIDEAGIAPKNSNTRKE